MDPVNSARPDVLQKAAEKFAALEMHFTATTAVSVVIVEHEPGVGDGIELVLREWSRVECLRQVAQGRLGAGRCELDEDRPRAERIRRWDWRSVERFGDQVEKVAAKAFGEDLLGS